MASATASLTLPLRIASPISGRKLAPGSSLSVPANIHSAKMVSNRTRIVTNALPSEHKKKEISVASVTAMALTAATIIPEIAEAAGPGVSPSLKNFLLSIVAGGVVLAVIGVAVIGVANFDPVKRT